MKKSGFVISLAAMLMTTTAHAANWQYPQAPAATTAAEMAALTPAVSAPAPFFTVSRADVEKAAAEQIKRQVADNKSIRAVMDPGLAPILHAADHPLKITLQAMQIDTAAHRWQGQAFIVGNKATESVRAVSGRYDTLISVPVLTRQFNHGDVIEASDIVMREIPERQLRKDTITNASSILGKSPLRMISADRPMRGNEIAEPVLIKKGDAVEMTFTAPSVHIRDQGEALEDGAKGALIRVKNMKTGRAVTARVEAKGHVEANPEKTM